MRVRRTHTVSESVDQEQHPPSSRGLKWSGIRAVAKVTALHLHSHGCQRLKGLKPLKHLLASSSILHVVKLLKAKERQRGRETGRERLGGCERDKGNEKGVCISLIPNPTKQSHFE